MWFLFFIEDALDANELVSGVFQSYYRLITRKAAIANSACLISTSDANEAAINQNGRNTMEELNEIFASTSSQSNVESTMSSTPLEPTVLNSPSGLDKGNGYLRNDRYLLKIKLFCIYRLHRNVAID